MLLNILKYGIIGSMVFTCFLIIMSSTGIASAMRNEEGHFKKRVNWKTVLGGLCFLSFLFGLLYCGTSSYLSMINQRPSFSNIWLNAFGIFMIVHLYDLIVLDYLIIVKWHPEFLNLPKTDYYTTIKPHVKGFFRGIGIGLAASFITTLFAYLALT